MPYRYYPKKTDSADDTWSDTSKFKENSGRLRSNRLQWIRHLDSSLTMIDLLQYFSEQKSTGSTLPNIHGQLSLKFGKQNKSYAGEVERRRRRQTIYRQQAEIM